MGRRNVEREALDRWGSARRSVLARPLAAGLFLVVGALVANGQGAAKGFDHGLHVSDIWMDVSEAEVARDCRGCHDYSVEDPRNRQPPESVCTGCHAFGAMEFPQGSYLDPMRDVGDVFDHYDHRDRPDAPIECRACHLPPGDTVPAVMPVPRGANVEMCARCHGSDAASRKGFNEVIASRLAGKESAAKPFRHALHVPPGQADDPRLCQSCHTKVYTSDAENLGERQFSVETCRDCHAAKIEVAKVMRPSRAAASFDHWDHLKSPEAQRHPELADQNCMACHAWDAAAETYRFTARFDSGFYEGCITCHTDRDVAMLGGRHGDTSDCAQCHRIEEGGLDPSRAAHPDNRPRALLPRPRPSSFALAAHAHPFVTTGGGGAVDGDCSACHRAQVPSIPSRLNGKPFDHATHLPARHSELEASHCLACHENIERESFSDLEGLLELAAEWSEGGAQTHPVLSEELGLFEEESCTKCHSDALGAVFPDSPLREVMWFSHDRHLNKRHPTLKRAFTCTDCHVVPSGEGFVVRVGDSYRNCTECHGHAEHAATTRNYDLDFVGSCAECHAVGIPEKGVPVAVERLTAGYAAGAFETHENSGECASCHVASTTEDPYEPPRERKLLARRIDSPHGRNSPYRQAGYKFFNQPVDAANGRKYCIDCHWEWEAVSLPLGVMPYYEREPYFEEAGVDVRELRAMFGTNLLHFPGFAAPNFRD